MVPVSRGSDAKQQCRALKGTLTAVPWLFYASTLCSQNGVNGLMVANAGRLAAT